MVGGAGMWTVKREGIGDEGEARGETLLETDVKFTTGTCWTICGINFGDVRHGLV